MKARRSLLLFLTLVLVPVGAGILWVWQAKRQYALDRQLIAALVHNDSKQALTLVNAGANPNTRYNPPPPPMLKILFSQLLHRRHPPAEETPTAWMIACGDILISMSKQEFLPHRYPDDPELVQAMLLHGADLSTQKEDTHLALMCSIFHNRVRTVELLLQSGADVNYYSAHYAPLLICAVAMKYPDITHLLLEHGANSNETDYEGNTALHFAMRPPIRENIVRQLLSHHANPSLPNARGETAIQYAQKQNRPDIVALLRGKR